MELQGPLWGEAGDALSWKQPGPASSSPSARLGALGKNRLQKGPKVAVGERKGGEEGRAAMQKP